MSMVICNEVHWTECIIGRLIYSDGISKRFPERAILVKMLRITRTQMDK